MCMHVYVIGCLIVSQEFITQQNQGISPWQITSSNQEIVQKLEWANADQCEHKRSQMTLDPISQIE